MTGQRAANLRPNLHDNGGTSSSTSTSDSLFKWNNSHQVAPKIVAAQMQTNDANTSQHERQQSGMVERISQLASDNQPEVSLGAQSEAIGDNRLVLGTDERHNSAILANDRVIPVILLIGSESQTTRLQQTAHQSSRDPNLVSQEMASNLSSISFSSNHHQGVASGGGQWLAAAASQTRQDIGQRMSLASDQLNHSLRQLYASASSIAAVETLPPSYHNIPGVVPYYHGRSIGPPPSYDDVINPYAPPPTYQSLFGQMREARKTSRGLIDLLRRLLIILISTLGCTLLLAFMILIPFTMIIVGAIYIDECQIDHIPAFLLVGGLVWASKNILHCYSQCKQQQQEQQQLAGGLDALAAELYRVNPSISSNDANSTNSASSNPEQNEHPQVTSANSLPAPSAMATNATDQQQRTRRRRPEPTTSGQQLQQTGHNFRLKSSICESLLNCVLFGWFIAGCVIIFRNYEPDFEHSTSARYCHRTVYMYTFWLISSALLLFGLFIGCICCLMVSSAVSSRQAHDDIDLA